MSRSWKQGQQQDIKTYSVPYTCWSLQAATHSLGRGGRGGGGGCCTTP